MIRIGIQDDQSNYDSDMTNRYAWKSIVVFYLLLGGNIYHLWMKLAFYNLWWCLCAPFALLLWIVKSYYLHVTVMLLKNSIPHTKYPSWLSYIQRWCYKLFNKIKAVSTFKMRLMPTVCSNYNLMISCNIKINLFNINILIISARNDLLYPVCVVILF